MKLLFLSFTLFLFSCSQPSSHELLNKGQHKNQISTDVSNLNTAIIEIFVDSLNIGEKGKTKIELIKHRVLEHTYVIVKFYNKSSDSWHIANTYLYECDAMMDLDPVISDFNNDKFNDVNFISATAARGANEVRRLFIYDPRKQALISILNSQDYPNMLYNKELNCIDAFLVHGGTTTVFARIKMDSLKEFARVNIDDHRTVYEIDKMGRRKLMKKDTITNPDDVYIRYSNYKPLKAY